MCFSVASLMRLKPLVRRRRVLESGLITVERAWPARKLGKSGRPGFRYSSLECGEARGVICLPVGRRAARASSSSSDAAGETAKEKRRTVARDRNIICY